MTIGRVIAFIVTLIASPLFADGMDQGNADYIGELPGSYSGKTFNDKSDCTVTVSAVDGSFVNIVVEVEQEKLALTASTKVLQQSLDAGSHGPAQAYAKVRRGKFEVYVLMAFNNAGLKNVYIQQSVYDPFGGISADLPQSLSCSVR